MIRVLFVCHGNICRSTMAEYVMKDLTAKAGLSDSFHIDSAATSREEIGNPVHHGTRRKLKQVGIPCGDHLARQMRGEEYDKFDYIIGMDTWNIRNINRIIGNNDPDKKVYKLLDYGAIGRKARMEEGGVFTSGGYVVQNSDLDVSYSRSQRPQQMEAAQ